MSKKKLTEKQKRFCDYYIQNPNASEAARKAGYSEKTAGWIGQENLRKPIIKEHINKRLKRIEDNRIMKAEEALQILTEIARGSMEEEVFTAKGDKRKKKADISQRQKAIDSLLKRYDLTKSEKVKIEKMIAEKQLIDEKVKLIRGESKDTGLMSVLIKAVKGEDKSNSGGKDSIENQ